MNNPNRAEPTLTCPPHPESPEHPSGQAERGPGDPSR